MKDLTPLRERRRNKNARRFRRRNRKRWPAKRALKPCQARKSVWLTLWEGEPFRGMWLRLLTLLRKRGISTSEPAYRSAVNATELQLVPRGKGFSVWWRGASCYWWIGVRGRI